MAVETDEVTSETDNSARAALQTIESEMHQLEPQYDALSVRLLRLRQTANTLRQLLGVERLPGHPVDWYDRLQAAPDAWRNRKPDFKADAELVQSAGNLAARPGGGDLGGSSTDHVLELLREGTGTAVTRSEIVSAFRNRGWVEPSWREPDAAIRMAIRRAARQDGVEQVSPDSWAYRPKKVSDVKEGGDA